MYQTWNLVALALQQIFYLRSRLGVAQWPHPPDKKFAQPPYQIPSLTLFLGIPVEE
jgi:hypothetical protein